MTINNNTQPLARANTALEMISQNRSDALLKEVTDFHFTTFPNESLVEIYSKFNLTHLLRHANTIPIATSIINHVLIPGLANNDISKKEIEENLTYYLPNSENSINAAELLTILGRQYEGDSKEKEGIDHLKHLVESKLDIHPSNAFNIRLEENNRKSSESRNDVLTLSRQIS